MRLIDADALMETYKKWIPQLVLPEDKGDRRGVETCIAVLEDAPTIEAEPVRHGVWVSEKCNHKPCRIKNPEKWVVYKCPGCGYSNGRKQSNYCPNCGAKMDGDSHD